MGIAFVVVGEVCLQFAAVLGVCVVLATGVLALAVVTGEGTG